MKRYTLPQKTKPHAEFPKENTEADLPKTTQQATSPKKRNRRKTGTGSGKQSQGTPYDDVFRTLLNDCTPMILPIINEMFGTAFTGDETIDLHPELHFLNRQGGEEEKRITDSSFTVSGTVPRHFLLEIQSTSDSSMLVRIFEYSTQIALDSGEITGNTLHVTIPDCGVLFLRSTRNTPERMLIRIDTPGGSASFDVQVLKTQLYTIDEIFEKKLFMLIPFYIFSHEKRFPEYNTDEEKLEELKTEYADIVSRLRCLKETGQISEYQHRMIIDMSGKVLKSIAAKYDNVREGVEETMAGRIIETEASRIYHEGEKLGEKREKKRTAVKLHDRGDNLESIADILEVDIRQVRKWIR
ncbi:MAG: helix-turn-helix domain-containing protein, partial [Lachnospiraceae bacterium]|nr:helix-turn-helix domain-containing protein [Lachnospiraceae bacterium]